MPQKPPTTAKASKLAAAKAAHKDLLKGVLNEQQFCIPEAEESAKAVTKAKETIGNARQLLDRNNERLGDNK